MRGGLQLAQNNSPALSSGRMGELLRRPFAHSPARSHWAAWASPGESGESRRGAITQFILVAAKTDSLDQGRNP